MKEESRLSFRSAVPFSVELLSNLKKEGYLFVKIRGYTTDMRLEYIDPYYVLLIPVKNLDPSDNECEIVEHIDAKTLSEWADEKTGIGVRISLPKSFGPLHAVKK